MITGSCPITMCKKAVPKEDPPIEIETTNVGFVNMSESAVSTIGIGEIISTIILVMIIGMIIRYCCNGFQSLELQVKEIWKKQSYKMLECQLVLLFRYLLLNCRQQGLQL